MKYIKTYLFDKLWLFNRFITINISDIKIASSQDLNFTIPFLFKAGSSLF